MKQKVDHPVVTCRNWHKIDDW